MFGTRAADSTLFIAISIVLTLSYRKEKEYEDRFIKLLFRWKAS